MKPVRLLEWAVAVAADVLLVLAYVARMLWAGAMDACRRAVRRPKSVRGRVVVVTGAAQGIGLELGRQFALGHGANVCLLDLREGALETACRSVQKMGGRAFPFVCDVTKPDELKRVAALIADHPELGAPDVVICNAGVLALGLTEDLSPADVRKVVDVNLLGCFWTTQAFLGRMKADNRGHLVFMSSIAGYQGEAYASAYSVSKFALRGLVECLEWELHDGGFDGVKLSIAFPYFTATSLIERCAPTARFFKLLSVNECASAIVDGVLKDKFEIFIPHYLSYMVTAVKYTLTQSAKIPAREMLGVRFYNPPK